jgi:Flp pilus assembly pilin Flp
MNIVKKFLADEDGASAVEYAVLVALIAAAVFTAVKVFDFNLIFTSASNKVKGNI